MKRLQQIIPICLLVLLCACNSVVEEPEKGLTLDFSALTACVQDGAEVADIAAVEREGRTVGYIVSFTDGSGVTLLNQTEGSAVKGLSEGADSWLFEIEGGENIILPKAAFAEPFKVELSGDEVELTDGGSVKASYKVTGAESGLEITVMAGKGWTADIDMTSSSEGTIAVTAPDPITTDKVLVSFKDESGRQVVRALRITSKSAVKRGNILTYANMGVRYYVVDPATVPYEVALARYQAVHDGGVQVMTCGQFDGGEMDALHFQLDLAEKVGVKMSVSIEQYSPEMVRYVVNDIKEHPALWGYMVCDEPNADEFVRLGNVVKAVKAVDTEHPTHINLHGTGGTFGPNGSYHTNTYDEYLERCALEADPDFFSFDVYPCITDYVVQKEWYSTLEQVAAKSKKYGKDFWTYTATCTFTDGNGFHCPPTVASIRLQNYTSLAYGSQALEYFTWAGDDQNMAVCNLAGDISTTNPTFEYLQFVNVEMQNRAFVFDGCDVKWAGLYREVPDGCQAVDESKIPEEISLLRTDDSFMMSYIENDGGESGYFCIVSRTHLKDSKIHLRFIYPVQTVERDGSLKTINPGDYDYTIEKGDILIIKNK